MMPEHRTPAGGGLRPPFLYTFLHLNRSNMLVQRQQETPCLPTTLRVTTMPSSPPGTRLPVTKTLTLQLSAKTTTIREPLPTTLSPRNAQSEIAISGEGAFCWAKNEGILWAYATFAVHLPSVNARAYNNIRARRKTHEPLSHS